MVNKRAFAGLAASAAMVIGGIATAGTAQAQPARDASIAAAPVITDLSCKRSGLSAYRCAVTHTGTALRYVWSVDDGPNRLAGSAIIVHCQPDEYHSVSVVVENSSGYDTDFESFLCRRFG